jgi:gluconolactonase
MTIDELGNLYFSGLGGVWIVSPQGEQLEFIDTPEAIYNVAFGGPNGRTLYMTCDGKLYSLDMNVRGGGNHSW